MRYLLEPVKSLMKSQVTGWMTVIDKLELFVWLSLHGMRYLIDSTEDPEDIWTTLDRVLGKHNKDHSRNLESTYSTSMVSIFQYVFASTFSDEFVHDEEFSQIFHVATILFDRILPLSIKKQILKSHIFMYLLKLKILIHLMMMMIMKKKWLMELTLPVLVILSHI